MRAVALGLLLLSVPAAAQYDARSAQMKAPKAWRVKPRQKVRSLVVWPDCAAQPFLGRWRGTLRCGQEDAKVFEALLFQPEGDEQGLLLATWSGDTWMQDSLSEVSGRVSREGGEAAFSGRLVALVPFRYDMALAGKLAHDGRAVRFSGALPERPTETVEARLAVTGRKGRGEATLRLTGTLHRCVIFAERLRGYPVRGCARE